MSVATLALQILLLDDLAGRLMLKLVVLKHCVQMTRYFWRFYLTEWLEAEAAGETPAPVVPHTPLTLDAICLAQHTSTGMLSQALSAEVNLGHLTPTGVLHRSLKNNVSINFNINVDEKSSFQK